MRRRVGENFRKLVCEHFASSRKPLRNYGLSAQPTIPHAEVWKAGKARISEEVLARITMVEMIRTALDIPALDENL